MFDDIKGIITLIPLVVFPFIAFPIFIDIMDSTADNTAKKVKEVTGTTTDKTDVSSTITGLFEVFTPIFIFLLVLIAVIFIIALIVYSWDLFDLSDFLDKLKKRSKNKTIRLLQKCLISETTFVHHQIIFLINLYEKDPKTYKPLVYKYAETFRIFHSVIFEVVKGKNKHVLKDVVFQQKVKDLLAYPIEDFKRINNLIKQNKDLEKETEIALLHSQIQDEIKMLDDIKKMHGTL